MDRPTLADKWYQNAHQSQEWGKGLPEVTDMLMEGTVSVHTFADGSRILAGHDTHWTDTEWYNRDKWATKL